jgi:ribosomal protein S18 acetylase RimI-like enzyme
MVRKEWHGRGAGRALTELRIERIREEGTVQTIALGTSQHTSAFYERMGFRTTSVEADGYAPGLDRVDMILGLRP